ncbi:hypothetical protein [Ruminococcus flavefaciens]|uniref:hypothetical protein n=1 Tax=Ruminococcus flavefaciens TaxID=1265 RepID=UPI0026EF2726|nr:hypothetical protein [Ruminococcus flavefaciens]
MKVKIAYTKEEEARADALAGLFLKELQVHSAVTLTRSDRHKPFYHIYIQDGRKVFTEPPKNFKQKPKKQ